MTRRRLERPLHPPGRGRCQRSHRPGQSHASRSRRLGLAARCYPPLLARGPSTQTSPRPAQPPPRGHCGSGRRWRGPVARERPGSASRADTQGPQRSRGPAAEPSSVEATTGETAAGAPLPWPLSSSSLCVRVRYALWQRPPALAAALRALAWRWATRTRGRRGLAPKP